MIAPFILLASLTTLVSAFGVIDSVWTTGAASAILAIALMVTAIALSVADLSRLTQLLPLPVILVFAVPALWMLVQVMPMPWHALANPIWASASAALNQQLVGAITVDIGTTLLSLAQYCMAIALVLTTTVVALDRRRAGYLLWTIVAVTTLIAADQIVLELVSPLRSSGEYQPRASFVAIAGVLASCATAIQSIEKLQRQARARGSRRGTIISLALASGSLFICTIATLLYANPVVFVAAALGAGVIFAVFAIRRWLLGAWGIAGLAAVAVIGILGIFSAIPVKKHADVATAFSTQDQAATERMLSDIPPAGSGAGTFNALLPIYRDLGPASSRERPTAAAAIAIEMGPLFLYGLIIATLLGAWILFSRALSRGHDYVYSAAGSGALLSSLVVAFANGSILNLGETLVMAILLGLAFAQSISGTARETASLPLPASLDAVHEGPQRFPSAPLPIFDRMTPRLSLALLGLLLLNQAIWILLAQGYSHKNLWTTSDAPARFSSAQREEMKEAASIAMVRGVLWADLGFALLGRRWTDPGKAPDHDHASDPAYDAFSRALRFAPHQADVWLALAGLSSQSRLAGSNTGALLKMSYYTAPNELTLLPKRLLVAFSDDAALKDPELRDMIKRDVDIVLSRQPSLKPALVSAYASMPNDRRILADRLISEVDPNYLKTIRAQFP